MALPQGTTEFAASVPSRALALIHPYDLLLLPILGGRAWAAALPSSVGFTLALAWYARPTRGARSAHAPCSQQLHLRFFPWLRQQRQRVPPSFHGSGLHSPWQIPNLHFRHRFQLGWGGKVSGPNTRTNSYLLSANQ